MKKLIFLLTLGTMCVLPASMAFADEPIVAEVAGVLETPEVMDKVIVTAGRIEESQRTVTQATTIIPREEIEKSQYTDLGGILRNYGIQVNNYGPGQGLSQVAIRGVRSSLFGEELRSGILLLVDGRRVGTDNVSQIPMVNIERVEIIRGPGAVQYGTSAIGGVINVITRRGPGNDKDLAAKLEVGGGSFETYKTEAELAGRKDKVDFSSGLSYLKSHDYKTGSGNTYYNTGLDYKLGYSANLGYNFTDEHRIGATVLGVRNENAGSPGELKYNDLVDYTDRNNYSMDLVYDGGYKDWGLNWKGRYYNGHTNYLNDDPNVAPSMGAPRSYSETDYQGAQGQLSWNKSFFTLTGGVDYLDSDFNNITFDQRSKYYNTGVFMLGKLAFLDDFVILSAGARQDYYDLNYEGEKGDFNHATPSVGVALNPTNWLTFRTNYGESYRVPAAIEMTGFPGFNYIGNPDLKPEEGKSWDMGVEVNHKSLNLGLTYFSTNYENKILRRIVGANEQYYNIDGTVKYQGLEAQASYDVGEFFDWSFMLRPYLNLTTMFKYEDEDGKTVPDVSEHNIAYGLNFDHTDWGLVADLRFTYYGKQEQVHWSPSFVQSDVTVDPTTIADLFVTKQIYDWVDVGTLSVKGEVRNMFDEDYDLVYGYPMPGRSFYVGFQYEY